MALYDSLPLEFKQKINAIHSDSAAFFQNYEEAHEWVLLWLSFEETEDIYD